jgi:serine/threonine protein phosphatase PrpC
MVREIRQGRHPSRQAIQHWPTRKSSALERQRSEPLPMGTTVVAVRVLGNRYEMAWVGDSRVYLWSDGQLASSRRTTAMCRN